MINIYLYELFDKVYEFLLYKYLVLILINYLCKRKYNNNYRFLFVFIV